MNRKTTAKRRTAVLYLRLSEADDKSSSLDRQRADLTAYAEREGLRIVATLEDEGFTGRKERAKAAEALRMIRDGEADALLAFKFDRFSRQGLSAVAELIDAIDARQGSALFVALHDGLNSDQPAWRIIASVLAEVARMESENTSIRVASFVEHAKHVGRWHGGRPPVGYRSAAATDEAGKPIRILEPDPVAVEHLTDAARRIVAGASVYAATRRLNASPCRPPAAKEWSIQTVKRALTGAAIVGRVKVRAEGTPREARAFELIRNADGTPKQVWPPVIPVDLWEQVRDVLAARNSASPMAGRVRAPGARARLLSGLIACGECGGPVVTGVTGEGRANYRCAARARGKTCAGASATAEPLEAYVSEWFVSTFGAMPVLRPVATERPRTELIDAREELESVTARLRSADLDEAAEEHLERRGRTLRRLIRELAAEGDPDPDTRLEPTGERFADVWARWVADEADARSFEAAHKVAQHTEVSTADDGVCEECEGARLAIVSAIAGRREMLAAAIDHVELGKGRPGGTRFDASRFPIHLNPSADEMGYEVVDYDAD